VTLVNLKMKHIKKKDEKRITANKFGQIRSFSDNVQSGDIVLLRKGLEIVTVGKIPESHGYQWNELFDDVYGWDLQHTRRVKWNNIKLDNKNINQLFSKRKQIPAFTAVDDIKITEPIHEFIKNIDFQTEILNELPQSIPKPLKFNEIEEELFNEGLPYDSVGKVISTIRRLRRMSEWYHKYGRKSNRPTEHEVVAHMILPLLLSLGWSEQLLAVEWKKVDLAAFKTTPTEPDECVLLCEAKGLWYGLQNALEQAIGYIEKNKLDNCKKIILTDGLRIYLHERKNDNNNWDDKANGYFNINKIRTRHLMHENTNAIKTLMALTPSGIYNNLKDRTDKE